MTINRWVSIGMMAAALMAAGPVVAQTAPAAGGAHQRAPGVPLAPNPGEVRSLDQGRGPDRSSEYRTPRRNDASRTESPDQTLPMPKPVPSIIAP